MDQTVQEDGVMENQLAVAKICTKEYRGELIKLLRVRKAKATKKTHT
jgi:hypothetical protein